LNPHFLNAQCAPPIGIYHRVMDILFLAGFRGDCPAGQNAGVFDAL
jgi:hypothetical protein